MKSKVGSNVKATPMRVAHAALPDSGASEFAKACPACEEGLLLVRRNDKHEVTNVDRCLLCGQVVIYTDASIAGWPLVDVTASKGLAS